MKKTHKLEFIGSQKDLWLTEKQYYMILQTKKNGSDGFMLEDVFYPFHQIKAWVTPKVLIERRGEIPALPTPAQKKAGYHLRALKQIRTGFINHFRNKEMTEKSKKILQKIDSRTTNYTEGKTKYNSIL